MFYKLATIFSFVVIAIQSLSSSQSQTLTNPAEENAALRQEVVALQNAWILERTRTKPCSPKATEAVDENLRLYKEVNSLKHALKAAELGILRSGIPDGALVLRLVDKIQRKVRASQTRMDGQGSTPLSRQFVAQHSELVQRLQMLGGALPTIHTRLVHEEMSLLHLQTVMQISLRELQSLIVETANVLGGKYEPATLVNFQLSSETTEMQKADGEV